MRRTGQSAIKTSDNLDEPFYLLNSDKIRLDQCVRTKQSNSNGFWTSNLTYGGSSTRPLPRVGGSTVIPQKFRGDPTVGPHPQGLDQRSKMEEVVPKRLRVGTILKDHQRLTASSWWCFCSHSSTEVDRKRVIQIPRKVRPSSRLPIAWNLTFESGVSNKIRTLTFSRSQLLCSTFDEGL